MISDLTINNTMNINHIEFDSLAGWGYTHKLSLVCTIECLPDPHFISCHTQVMDSDLDVRESGKEHGEELFSSLEVRHGRYATVIDEVRTE